MVAWMIAFAAFGVVTTPQARVERLLKAIETHSKNVRDFRCQFERRCVDPTWHTDEKLVGTALGARPGLLSMTLRDSKGQIEEAYIVSPAGLECYRPKSKQRCLYFLPKPDTGNLKTQGLPRILDPQFWSYFISTALPGVFLGLPIQDLRTRFRTTISKENADWVWLELFPRDPDDPDLILAIQMVLKKSDYLPRRTTYHFANRNEVHWTITRRETNVTPPVTAGSLHAGLPTDWPLIDMRQWPKRVQRTRTY